MNPLIKKLNGFTDFPPDDVERLVRLCDDIHVLKAGHVLIDEGSCTDKVFLLLEGWACRYKVLEDGRRQIVAFLIPGDLCDIHIFILKTMDHAIGLLSDATVAMIPKDDMLRLIEQSPLINRALWWSTLIDEAILREWLVNSGQRDAYHRIAHLFCEMWLRMKRVGLVDGPGFRLPLTQEDLADTMGLTSVHVSRVLKRLRSDGLITLKSKQLEIHDVHHLMEIAHFDPGYLHLT
jgi:CRP-like cAMP-binding protein